jgi:hypothetical protein
MGNHFKKKLTIEGIIQKLLLLLLALYSSIVADPKAQKIGDILSKIALTPHIYTYRAYVDTETRTSIYVFPTIFDHNNNLWIFWKEYIGEWQEEPISKTKIPPNKAGVFCKKIDRNGRELIPKKLLYKGYGYDIGVTRQIFQGPDNSLYHNRGTYLERMDSLGNLISRTKELDIPALDASLWLDTINNKIFFYHMDNFGENGFSTFDAKTLMILDTLTISKNIDGKLKLDKRISLPPNLKWNYRHHKDQQGAYEVDEDKYIATDWFNSENIIICGAKNPTEGFVHRININNQILIDSFSFELEKSVFKRYENVSLPKVQIVKGKKDFWVYIPLREGEREWVSVIRLDSTGKLVNPTETKVEKPKDFDRIPIRTPKQVLVKQIGSQYEALDKVWEVKIDFCGFNVNGDLYYYRYRKKVR